MDSRFLNDIAVELDAELRGALVSKVHQPDDRALLIKFFSMGKEKALLIATSPGLDSMHLTGLKFTNPPTPLRFCALLRSRITSARVESIGVEPGERIARIGLVAPEGAKSSLVVELTGKSGNVILVDDKGVIIDALRYFPAGESARVVEPGASFVPLTVAGIAAAPKIEAPVEKTAATWNETADERYKTLLEKKTDSGLKSELGRAINKASGFVQKKLRNLAADRASAEVDLDKTRLGELLTANFHAMKRGMSEVEVDDFYADPPEKVKVALDARLGPAENVERLFKRAKKAKTALKLLAGRIPELEAELEYLKDLSYNLDAAGDLNDVEAIKDELLAAGYLKKPAGPARGKVKREPRAEPVKKLKTSDGFDLLMGKSGLGNDLIVKKYARAKDLWFHAKGTPGAHVLLRIEGTGREPSDAAIEEAGRLAAQNSSLRAEKKAEVICAEAKELKRPAGAKPGMVRVNKYRTIIVKVEDD